MTPLSCRARTHPTVFVHRPMAIVSVAMFDAANSFDRVYRPVATLVNPAPGARATPPWRRRRTTRSSSCCRALRETFDAALATSLAGIPPDAATEGSRVGAAVAQATLELRANDGWNQTPPPYVLPNLPGYWKPTPPANAAAAFTHYPDVTGFVVPNGRRFLMEPHRRSRARVSHGLQRNEGDRRREQHDPHRGTDADGANLARRRHHDHVSESLEHRAHRCGSRAGMERTGNGARLCADEHDSARRAA